jgi:hypothetical protein
MINDDMNNKRHTICNIDEKIDNSIEKINYCENLKIK